MKAPEEIYIHTDFCEHIGEDAFIHLWTQHKVENKYNIKYIRADLAELTWEHIWNIWNIIDDVRNDFCDNPKMFNLKSPSVDSVKQAICEEILRRFNKIRGK